MEIFKYTDLALQIVGRTVAPPLVGIFLGKLLDSYFSTGQSITLILLLLGVATGFKSLFDLLFKLTK